jgi:hypothetical protein
VCIAINNQASGEIFLDIIKGIADTMVDQFGSK